METDIELIRLEDFVDKVLNKFNQLKKDHANLQQTLRERDAECANLKETVASLSKERAEVGDRVVGLIGRIEQWENEQNEADRSTAGDSAYGGQEGVLFGADNADHRPI